MLDLQQDINGDEWKTQLRDEMITLLTGTAADQKNAYWRIGYHYNCSAPASLYKYYGDNPRCLQSIKENKMWYSAPCNFNDVFDCGISVDEKEIFNCALRLAPDNMKIRAGSPAWKHIKGVMTQELKSFRATFERLRSSMGVACLSESFESLLMWAHYANNHRGMCVEYDLMEINQQLNFTPIPIIYSDERVCFNTLNPATAGNDSMRFFIRSITSKSKDWSYEREWRIIRDNRACGDRWDEGKKGALLDMIVPSSITLGCESTEEFEKEIRAYCKQCSIPLYKMEKDTKQYRINRVEVFSV